jgi:hypothetical protein
MTKGWYFLLEAAVTAFSGVGSDDNRLRCDFEIDSFYAGNKRDL